MKPEPRMGAVRYLEILFMNDRPDIEPQRPNRGAQRDESERDGMIENLCASRYGFASRLRRCG